MPIHETSSRKRCAGLQGLVVTALALLALHCGDAPPEQIPPGLDGGGLDAGPNDAGPNDAGPDDAGQPHADLIVTPHVPVQPRRGPVVLGFDLIDPDHDVDPALVLEWQDGETWRAATVLSREVLGSRVTLAWNSFADAPFDGAVALRVLARDPGGDVELPFTIELRNAPDPDRIVLVGHHMKNLEGGGASAQGNEVSALVLDGLGGGLLGAPRRLLVGHGPRVLRAAPHGRATAVHDDSDGTVTIIATPLDALVANVAVLATLPLPNGDATGLAWSPDGRRLYVTGSSADAAPPALWRFTPSEDLSDFGEATRLTDLPGPPMYPAVEPTTGRILVVCGSGGTGDPKLVLLDLDGTEKARFSADFAPPNALVFAPSGGLAVLTGDLFGDEIRFFDVGPASLLQRGATLTSIEAPNDVVFHPAPVGGRPTLLISNLHKNRATPVVVQESGVSIKSAVTGVPLAAEMDLVERGGLTGTVLVSAVTKVQRMILRADGTASSQGTLIDFGAGTTNITQGIALQR